MIGLILGRAWGLLKAIPWQVWAAIAIAAAIALYGHHREQTGRAEGRAEIIAKWEREKAKDAERYQAAVAKLAAQSLAYETLAQSLRASERTDRETIREIYRDKIVPAECAADPAVVRLLSEAVTDANATATGKPRSELPVAPKPSAGADRPRP